MAKIIFISGGARSGKSAFAQRRVRKYRKVAYIATGMACDGEMKERIKRHRADRPASWKTFEEPMRLDLVALNTLGGFDAAILDCVGAWVTNLLLHPKKKPGSAAAVEEHILLQIESFLKHLAKHKKLRMVIVSNEAGLGLVPPTKLGREFRDILGRVNQMIARESAEAYFMVSGLPQKLK
ncbi:MAG TPA: bifunctional adenosylcobinamide kinase/adenosylcobinamide-phosphate guanylyltransferase [bacterium]|nr:bifunctional adenosylcobinamide kinase/adenosylcobinamide-phosphate guanylyltransferase [bacterium]